MSLLQTVWQDLKSRKLLPVAAVLLVAIAAVPIVLSSSSSAPPPMSPSGPPAATAAGLPAVSESAGPSSAAPGGHSRDPFAPAAGAGSPSGTSTTTTATTPPGGGPTGSSGPQSSSSTGTTTTGTTTTGGTSTGGTSTTGGTTPGTPSSTGGGGHSPGSKIPTPKPKPTTAVLSADQSYSVSLAITNASGGIDTINPLERLSLLPSAGQPLLVELGVLRGGSRVLFAVQPGTVLSGPGSCVPGPIDCEILSLAQSQTETLSVSSKTGTRQVALFAVTGITAVKHSSHSAAMTARNQESSAGRRLLDHSSLNALSLFRYEPSVGSVVDLRNLTLRDS